MNTFLVRASFLTLSLVSALANAVPAAADPAVAPAPTTEEAWGPEVVAALDRAGANRAELVALLRGVPPQHLESALFLVANMPDRDLATLKADFLRENIALAHEAVDQAPWGARIPRDVFLDAVLPYANVSERREAWRKDFRDRFAPLIAGATSPGKAAVLLNQKVFPLVGVKYSTQRKRADQSPLESMETGLASCTGLSILLIDACRALGIPARFVGTPLWSDKSGNHSWVEVWDDGWHYTGAAEPTGDRLNEGWFTGIAATATRDDPAHGIYAVCFRKTPVRFPLVWDRAFDQVPAVDVTDSYTRADAKPPAGTSRVSFRVLDPQNKSRVVAHVRVTDPAGTVVLEGDTKDERFDANDHLHQHLQPGTTYRVDVTVGEATWTDTFEVDEAPRLMSWNVPGLNQAAPAAAPAQPAAAEADGPTLRALRAYLEQPAAGRKPIERQPFATAPLSKDEALAAEKLLVADRQATLRTERRAEMDAKVIQIGDLKMPFAYTVFGEKPAGGRSLFISMHGGGNAPKQVNDGQWQNQKGLYKPAEGVYLVPRAPTDTWNLWHEGHIDTFFDRLIEDLVLFEDVNPDRVYLMGYSAGGDGVYQLAPRMSDRFAAAAMMAGHPNETSPLGLRNLPFALQVGERDNGFDRNKIGREWEGRLAELRKADPDGYVHLVKIHPGKGHWMDLQEAEALPWMSQFTRNRYPKKVVWKQDDRVQSRLYWLGVDPEGLPERALVVAEVDGQTIRIADCDPAKLTLFLRDELVDMSQKITVTCGDKQLACTTVPRTIATIARTIAERGDPQGAFWGTLEVSVPRPAR